MQKIPVKIGNLEEITNVQIHRETRAKYDDYRFNVPLSWLPIEVFEECMKCVKGEPIIGLVWITWPWGFDSSYADILMGIVYSQENERTEFTAKPVLLECSDISELIEYCRGVDFLKMKEPTKVFTIIRRMQVEYPKWIDPQNGCESNIQDVWDGQSYEFNSWEDVTITDTETGESKTFPKERKSF